MVASQMTNLPSCRQGSSHRHKTSTRRRVNWLTGQVLTSSGSGQWSHLADSNIQLADNGRAPPFLSEHCIPVSSADTRRHLRSASHHLLAVPHFRLNTYGRRAFSVAGPMAWNSLPDFIRDPTSSTDCFRRLLETRDTSASSASGVLNDYALYKPTHWLSEVAEFLIVEDCIIHSASWSSLLARWLHCGWLDQSVSWLFVLVSWRVCDLACQ